MYVRQAGLPSRANQRFRASERSTFRLMTPTVETTTIHPSAAFLSISRSFGMWWCFDASDEDCASGVAVSVEVIGEDS